MRSVQNVLFGVSGNLIGGSVSACRDRGRRVIPARSREVPARGTLLVVSQHDGTRWL